MEIKLNTIEEAIEDFKAGELLIMVDDEDRENEGDFIVSAEKVTEEKINFMLAHGRGLLCTPITEKRAAELELNMMVSTNTSLHETPFTVFVDKLGDGCTTGISVHDRTKTVRAMADENTKPCDLARPGHVAPLRAREAGVLQRAGHTEGCVDMAKLAGLKPAAALIEILNEDGTMARLPQLMEISKKYGIKIISIKDLIAYRIRTETLIRREETALLPTQWGDFNITAYTQLNNEATHLVISKGTWEKDEPILVRVHSSCATGDIFGSCRCDCGNQLHESMRMINEAGKGMVVYLAQEGRGIGLANKVRAYHLQDNGMDTVEANVALGFKPDERDYGVGAQIIRDQNATKIKLLTNNPRKRQGLEGYGLKIVEVVPIIIQPGEHNYFYLKTKQNKMGHDLHLGE